MSRLFIFDMDGTLLPGTTGMLQIAQIMGHTDQLQQLETQYITQQIDSLQFALNIFHLWENLSPKDVEAAFTKTPKLNNIKEALKKINERGDISCLITTAPHFFAHHFHNYGFDHIFASKPFNLIERKFSPYDVLHAKDKPHIARQLCETLHLPFQESVAFGDSVSDIPLFQTLEHTVAVNGDMSIKTQAKFHYEGFDLLEALDILEI